MYRRPLAAAALALVLCAAQGEPPLDCPPGSRRRQRDRDFACETPVGVGEGPFWGRYESGRLRYWSEARDGKTHGTWITWHPSGEKATEAEYRGGELVGAFRQWDADGKLVYAGTHDATGEMHGTWTRWWPNGEKRLEWAMVHGHQHGEVAAWWQSGTRKLAGRHEAGRREGTWTWWDERGVETASCRYRDGSIVTGVCSSE